MIAPQSPGRPRDAKGRFTCSKAPTAVSASRRPMRMSPSLRNYSAGEVSRLTEDWFSSDLTPDQAIAASGRITRNRARALERDNPFIRRFLSMAVQNVVGHNGIGYRPRPIGGDGKLDKGAVKILREGWSDWGEVGTCTVCGRLAWPEVQGMLLRRLLVDGEVLLRHRRGYDNDFGYAVQVLDADMLDTQHNEKMINGRRIVMGVEVDIDERPKAYWLRQDLDQTIYSGKRIRVPADEIIHWYIQERPHQTRGVTWLASTMMRANMLDGYEDAVVVGARVAASKLGFFTPGEEYDGDGRDADGFTVMNSEPGEFEELPRGMGIETFDPDYPPANFAEFEAEIKRGIASGLNVSYVTLANDLSGVNYSSIRQGELNDRDAWRMLQWCMIRHIDKRVHPEWLRMALVSQAVPLPIGKFRKFARSAWHPRGWEWVDPAKEIKAATDEVDLLVSSRTEIAARRGKDFEEVLAENEVDEEMIVAHNLSPADMHTTEED